MTLLPQGVKVHLALGYTDMRKGIDGLAMLVQGVLHQDPFSGHLFVFRGRKANLIKIVFWDGTGFCLFTKRLEQGVFLWPPSVEPGESLALNSAQLSFCQSPGRDEIAGAFAHALYAELEEALTGT
jgi:transposase